MLSCPNGRRKNAIWEQYDSMVQLHTIAGPGEPAAIVEVPDTRRACVLTMEAEPYKCWTDPYTGASEAMALSLRGLWLTGADALGMTNCLNFASPEMPEKFYELKECLRGLADTCRALDCPVVSGNVSLYNETATDRIYPSPLVVTAGLVTDRDKTIRAGRTKERDFIYLVGGPEGSRRATPGGSDLWCLDAVTTPTLWPRNHARWTSSAPSSSVTWNRARYLSSTDAASSRANCPSRRSATTAAPLNMSTSRGRTA